jgi:6-pyruvoyltetrahydropterin/6-carboxytetrahydropterin synthase
MVTLKRRVRFGIAPHAPDRESAYNGFGGSPSIAGLGAHYEIDVECAGEPDSITGYLINIKTIDRAVRSVAVPRILDRATCDPSAEPSAMIAELADAIAGSLDVSVSRVAWRLSPTYTVEHEMETKTVLLKQQFDFAASHRLHVPTLSDDENRRLFGKCNHPSGHGHNYRVEPCLELEPGVDRFTLRDLERLAGEHIIEPFDHKHLNIDTIEFGATGLNPSVENIAKVCYERLAEAIDAHGGARLRSLTVWETDRTSATYPA